MLLFRLLPLIALLAHAPAALAQSPSERLEIGEISLELRTLEDMSLQVQLGERILTSADRIGVGEQMVIGDTFVRVLEVGSGGSVCDGALQVLWARGQEVGVSEKTDPCLYPEVAYNQGALELQVKPLPAQPGQNWRWSPERGLEQLPNKPFMPNPDQSWEDFETLANSHPIDVLSFAPIYAQFKAALSEQDFTTLALTLNQLGWGEAATAGYAGEACAKWECDTRFAYLWVDITQEQAYAFWKVDGKEFASPLPLKDWPQWVVMQAAEKLQSRN